MKNTSSDPFVWDDLFLPREVASSPKETSADLPEGPLAPEAPLEGKALGIELAFESSDPKAEITTPSLAAVDTLPDIVSSFFILPPSSSAQDDSPSGLHPHDPQDASDLQEGDAPLSEVSRSILDVSEEIALWESSLIQPIVLSEESESKTGEKTLPSGLLAVTASSEGWPSPEADLPRHPEDDVVFTVPTVFDKPQAPLPFRIHEHSRSWVFQGRTLAFRGNSRRFVILLTLSLLLSSPLTFAACLFFGLTHPIQATLGLHTLLAVGASLSFVFGSYRRRCIFLDDFGIRYEDELRSLYVLWKDVASIHLHAVEAFFNPYPLCYVRLVTAQGEEIGFANCGHLFWGIRRRVSFGNPPYPIIDIRDADFLLALIVQQTEKTAKVPDLAWLLFRAEGEAAEEAENPKLPKDERRDQSVFFGMWALTSKIFFKILGSLPSGGKVLLQSIKPAYAGASLGIYAVFFRIEFALMLLLILVVHELGHVWAMARAGMRIRGVYLIPFFGAATVTDDVWPSWAVQAKVNLAGPLWGTYLSLACLGIYALYPSNFWLATAVWGSVINLLNLMPVHPLDGGRILNSIAYSLRSSVGFVITLFFLSLGVFLSIVFELVLLYILCLIGIAEFFKEFSSRRRADKLACLRDRKRLTAREILLLKSVTGINFGDRNTPHILEGEEIDFKRLRMILDAPAMDQKEIIRIGLLTGAVFLSLFCFLLLTREINPYAAMAIEIFR